MRPLIVVILASWGRFLLTNLTNPHPSSNPHHRLTMYTYLSHSTPISQLYMLRFKPHAQSYQLLNSTISAPHHHSLYTTTVSQLQFLSAPSSILHNLRFNPATLRTLQSYCRPTRRPRQLFATIAFIFYPLADQREGRGTDRREVPSRGSSSPLTCNGEVQR